jgi:flagellar hook-length control protein FliK
MTSAVPSVASSPAISTTSSTQAGVDSGFSDELTRAQSRKPADKSEKSASSSAPVAQAKSGGKTHRGGGHAAAQSAGKTDKSAPVVTQKPGVAAKAAKPEESEENPQEQDQAEQDSGEEQAALAQQQQAPGKALFKSTKVQTESGDEEKTPSDEPKNSAPASNPAPVAAVKDKPDTAKDQPGKRQGKSAPDSAANVETTSTPAVASAQSGDAAAAAVSATVPVAQTTGSQEIAPATPDDSAQTSPLGIAATQGNIAVYKGSQDDAATDSSGDDATDTAAQATTGALPAETDDSSAAAAALPADKIKTFAKSVTIDVNPSASPIGSVDGTALKPGALHGTAIPAAAAADTPAPAAPSAEEIAQANHAQIVSSIHGQLMPNGGTMQITMNPPELGELQINVNVHDGVVSASFETTNDNATRLLSRSLGQLKSALETQGIGVERLHVQQAPSSEQSNSNGKNGEDSNRRQGMEDQRGSQQEQQRRELMRRLWRRVSGGRDELDMVA